MTNGEKIQLIKDKFLELFGVEVQNSDIRAIVERQIILDSDIVRAIEKFGLKGKSRKRELVYMRAYLSDILRRRGELLINIGELFGRDHSVVVHYLKLYDNFKDDDYYLDSIKPLMEYLNTKK